MANTMRNVLKSDADSGERRLSGFNPVGMLNRFQTKKRDRYLTVTNTRQSGKTHQYLQADYGYALSGTENRGRAEDQTFRHYVRRDFFFQQQKTGTKLMVAMS